MKKLLLGLFALIIFNTLNAQDTTKKKLVFNPSNPTYEVEASCGTCMFKISIMRLKVGIEIKVLK
jgi:hypothetical protein